MIKEFKLVSEYGDDDGGGVVVLIFVSH